MASQSVAQCVRSGGLRQTSGAARRPASDPPLRNIAHIAAVSRFDRSASKAGAAMNVAPPRPASSATTTAHRTARYSRCSRIACVSATGQITAP